ncbi:MAG: efflux RND transporter permease subunit [Bryobacteraceae bacterium]
MRQSKLSKLIQRIRPVQMMLAPQSRVSQVSCYLILGMLPLVIASGAGSASRHSLGTTVFGGMISATVLEVFIVPVSYVMIQGFDGAVEEKVHAGDLA